MVNSQNLFREYILFRSRIVVYAAAILAIVCIFGLAALLVGSPLKLPRIEVLSELVEGVARELLEIRVEGTLEKPQFRAEMVKSVRKALEAVLSARRKPARAR